MTDKLGKQHLGLAICLSQSVGKTVVDYSSQAKSSLKQTLSIARQLTVSVSQAQSSALKAKAKYVRAVQDADQALLSRDRYAADLKDRQGQDGFITKVDMR